MKAFIKMSLVEAKLFLREPLGVFFTLAFPLILLFVFGSIYGNEPSELFGGYGSVDISVPGYIGMIIGTIGLIGLPISIATYREQGILRRLRATPVHPVVILGSHLVVQAVVAIVSVAILVATAVLVYDLRFPEAPLSIIPAILFSAMSFFAVSFVLAGLLPSPRVAQAVGSAVFFPMLFLSGGAQPREILPETMQRIGDFLPLTHVVELLKGLWFGDGWNPTALAVLAGMLIIASAVSARTFRWEA